MDELLDHAPRAHAFLDSAQLADDLKASLSHSMRQLTHEELVHKTKGNDIIGAGPRHEHISPAEFNESQQEQHTRVDGLLEEVARLTSDAAHELSVAPPDLSPVGDRETVIFSRAKSLAFQEASSARESGDTAAVARCIESIITLDLLEGTPMSDGTLPPNPDRSVAYRAINLGFADEFVDALGNLHGIVAIGGSGEGAVSIPYRNYHSANLLRLATNRDFDDQFQHQQELFGTSLSSEDIQKQAQLIDSLDAIELNVLAHQRAEQKNDKEQSTYLSLKALEKIRDISFHSFNCSSSDIAEVITYSIANVEATDNQVDAKQCEERLAALREHRTAGLKPYRINSDLPSILDDVLVVLAAQDNKRAIYALISSSPHELAPEDVDSDSQTDFNLDYALRYPIDYDQTPLSQEEQNRIKTTLIEIQAEKIQNLRNELSQNGASNEIIDQILSNSSDPDSAFDVPPEFWTLHDLTHEEWKMTLGEPGYPSFKVSQKAKFILLARLSGIEHAYITERLELEASKHQDKNSYMQSIAKVTAALESHFSSVGTDNYFYSGHGSAFNELMEFDDPVTALEILRLMSQEDLDFRNLSELSKVLTNNAFRNRNSEPIHIPPEWLREITATLNGDELKTLLSESKLSADAHRLLLRRIIGSENMIITVRNIHSALSEIGPAKLQLESGLDANSQKILTNSILESTDMLSTASQIREALTASNLMKYISEYNPGYYVCSTILDTVLSAENMVEQAQEISTVFSDPDFVQIISDNGPAFGMRDTILDSVAKSANMHDAARKITDVFKGGGSLWQTTSQLAKLSITQSSFYSKGAMTSAIPVSLPLRSATSYNPSAIRLVEGEAMLDQLQNMWGVGSQVIEEARLNNGAVSIELLPEELQSTLLTAYLYEAITISRDQASRAAASVRNQSVHAEQLFQPGNLHHFTSSSTLAAILQNGLLPGEFIADQLRADAYPFNVDLVESTARVADLPSFEQRRNALASKDFGDMCLTLIRGESDDVRRGSEYSVDSAYGGQHRLIPGGISATEISAISLSDPTHLAKIKEALLEAGVFIPVYDNKGQSLYSYGDFQADRIDGNYDTVTPEIVDLQFRRPESQRGSNEGAEFIVPNSMPGAQSDHYYCKFAKPDAAEHIWSELLTDSLYREVMPSLVPETSAVILEGRLARASKWTRHDDEPLSNEARNAGFLLDCLVGNWDATFNAANLVMSDGNAVRIDTGNALFFRAKGEKKTEGTFGNTVPELEVGGDRSSLNLGMRQNYPGLTIDDINTQAKLLRERLTDERIDDLVDSVRMSNATRAELKKLLKSRKDYILDWADDVISGARSL